MNDSHSIPVVSVFAGIFWALATLGVIGAWVLVAVGHPHAATAMGFTACLPCGAAIALTIRSYCIRLSRLVRVVGGLPEPEPVQRPERALRAAPPARG